MHLNFMTLAAAADLNRISLASWDWIVIAIFFVAMVWICWDVARKKKETSGDYFLSGRSATWIAIGASIFAESLGITLWRAFGPPVDDARATSLLPGLDAGACMADTLPELLPAAEGLPGAGETFAAVSSREMNLLINILSRYSL